MKRKDDLLRLAFGELSDDAARAVESGADDAGREEIASFRSLREGLQHLPPPPPDGLSAERLRAAILDRDLKVRRSPIAWGQLLFAPVALAALAAVVVLPRLRPQPGVEIVGAPSSTLALKAPALDFPSSIDRSEPSPVAAVASPDPASAPRAEATVAVRHRHRRHRAPEAAEPPEDPVLKDAVVVVPKTGDDPVMGTVVAFAARTSEPDTISAPPSSVVEAAPGAEGRTETVVMVSGKRDLETGAPAATEKEATSVLVGG